MVVSVGSLIAARSWMLTVVSVVLKVLICLETELVQYHYQKTKRLSYKMCYRMDLLTVKKAEHYLKAIADH